MTRIGKKLLTIMIVVLAAASCKTTEGRTTYKVDYQYYPAEGEEKGVAIIFLGGSAGGFPDYDYHSFRFKGYPAMGLGYFGTENTPSNLDMVPLEYFEEAIKVFKSKDNVKDKKIVVIGGSKGGELALLVASVYPEIEGVVGKSPSSVVFQALSSNNSSCWSLNGNPVPFVPYANYDFSNVEGLNFLDFYNKTLNQDIDMEDAMIKVENINGPILLLSGTEDICWPATDMCNSMIKRLDEKGFGFDYEHIAYEGAGHTLIAESIIGGTFEANQNADLDSTARIYEFLEKLDNM